MAFVLTHKINLSILTPSKSEFLSIQFNQLSINSIQFWDYTTGSEVYSSPAVADGKVYVGSWDDKVYCLNAATGAWIWDYTTGDIVYSSPAVADGKVYVGSWDSKVYCLNAATGAWVWDYTTGNYVYSSPAVADGKVYVGSWDDSKVYAFGPTADSIPTLTEWGMIIFITVILGIGVVMIIRKRRMV